MIRSHRPPARRLVTWCGLLAASICLFGSGVARAQDFGHIDIEQPGPRQFVLDNANLINDADEQQIKALADKLLTDKAAPIVVVTIDSMAKHGGANLRIETFARLLFDQWGIGPEKVNGQAWNYGILLLVSRDDRKARIELGAGWRRDKDIAAQTIMDQQIVPRFKSGDFSGGILQGVVALDGIARGLQLPTRGIRAENPGRIDSSFTPVPSRPTSAADFLIPAALIGLVIFTVVSLVRRGSGGWAWVFWSVVFTIIGSILFHLATSRRSRHWGSGFSGGSFGGGSFGGGSFGGGFSGGGGASGSW